VRDDECGFVEAVGERMALLGRETLEVWMWPLLLVEELVVEARLRGAPEPSVPTGRRVHVVPEGLALEWTHAGFRLWLEACAAPDERSLVLLVSLEGERDVDLRLRFRPAFRPMWPAGLGGQISGRDEETGALLCSEELGRFAALIGSPEAAPLEAPSDRGLRAQVELRLAPDAARARRGPVPILFAGAQRAPAPLGEEARRGGEQAALGTARAREVIAAARASYRGLCAGWEGLVAAARARWAGFLERLPRLACADPALERAWTWSAIAIERAWVTVDGLGRSLVAGLGPSFGGERPGFAWFFSGDALTATRPLAALGAREACRALLRWVAATQRADGKIAHEVTLSGTLCDWFGDYPYAYYKGQCTPGFVACLEHAVRWTEDDELARELWPAARRALAWCASTCDEEGRMRVPLAGIAAVEAGPLAGRIDSELYLQGIWVSALVAGVRLAERLGEQADARAWSALLARAREGLESFWSSERGRYAFARLEGGARCEDLSAYTSLALSRDLGLDPERARSALQNNRPELTADWGARMFATDSAVYDPEHYNTGSVFPYLTNFLVLALFRGGWADAGWQVLRSQVALQDSGGLGYLPEFLAGDRARLLPRAVPHQVFSETTVLAGVLFGALGLEARRDGALAVRAALPADLPRLSLAGASCAGARFDLALERGRVAGGGASFLRLTLASAAPLSVAFEPLLPPLSRVRAVLQGGRPRPFELAQQPSGAPRVLVAPARGTELVWEVRFEAGAELAFPHAVELGAPSRHPRLVDQSLERAPGGEPVLRWTLAGRAGTRALLGLSGDRALAIDGATLDGDVLSVDFPPGADWTEAHVRVSTREP